MYTVSNDFIQAVKRGANQHIKFVFVNRTIRGDEIDIEAKVHFEEHFNDEENLAIGQCLSSELSFTLFNERQQFTEFAFGEFTAYLGVEIGQSVSSAEDTAYTIIDNNPLREYYVLNHVRYDIAYVPLGVFIAKRPNVNVTKEIFIQCYDRMTLFDEIIPSNLCSFPVTAKALLTAICTRLNVPLRTTTFLNETATIDSQPEDWKSMTYREVLKWIAEVACANARFDRDGYLELAWFNTVNRTFDEHDYEEFAPYWYQTPSVDAVHVRNASNTVESVVSVGTGKNKLLIQDNPFFHMSEEVGT